VNSDFWRLRKFHELGSYAEGFECLEEERFARCVVAHSEFDVVKRKFS
jgi:hypothetical protein